MSLTINCLYAMVTGSFFNPLSQNKTTTSRKGVIDAKTQCPRRQSQDGQEDQVSVRQTLPEK
jgi:hypothetical protein